MIPVEDARRRAIAAVRALPPVRAPLSSARGRHLVGALTAPRAIPGVDNSAMDGFAVRAADTAGARRSQPVRLPVVARIFAGALPPRALRPGEATRPFPGTPLPSGAKTVIRK
ncbi:MAG: molybdopterin molybdenumtransferase MoeA, partial [Myxococcales bacterium]